MTKDEILKNIENCFETEKTNKARNSMGNSESLYNPYYLIGCCFTDDKRISVSESELNKMSESELNYLIKLAEYSSEAFY